MEYTMENFMKDKFIIICKDKNEKESAMKMFRKEGIKWNGGLSVAYTHCDEDKTECYYSHAGALQCGQVEWMEDRYEKVYVKDFISANKSNKEKVLDIIGVKIGEKFNLPGCSCNPYVFNHNYDLVDRDGDKRNLKISDILWEDLKIEKIPEDPNTETKKHIELISNKYFGRNNMQEAILFLLKEISELKESKFV